MRVDNKASSSGNRKQYDDCHFETMNHSLCQFVCYTMSYTKGFVELQSQTIRTESIKLEHFFLDHWLHTDGQRGSSAKAKPKHFDLAETGAEHLKTCLWPFSQQTRPWFQFQAPSSKWAVPLLISLEYYSSSPPSGNNLLTCWPTGF